MVASVATPELRVLSGPFSFTIVISVPYRARMATSCARNGSRKFSLRMASEMFIALLWRKVSQSNKDRRGGQPRICQGDLRNWKEIDLSSGCNRQYRRRTSSSGGNRLACSHGRRVYRPRKLIGAGVAGEGAVQFGVRPHAR